MSCRKALELAVKQVYAADQTMKMPCKDNLQSLIHEPTFRFSVDYDTLWMYFNTFICYALSDMGIKESWRHKAPAFFLVTVPADGFEDCFFLPNRLQ